MYKLSIFIYFKQNLQHKLKYFAAGQGQIIFKWCLKMPIFRIVDDIIITHLTRGNCIILSTTKLCPCKLNVSNWVRSKISLRSVRGGSSIVTLLTGKIYTFCAILGEQTQNVLFLFLQKKRLFRMRINKLNDMQLMLGTGCSGPRLLLL